MADCKTNRFAEIGKKVEKNNIRLIGMCSILLTSTSIAKSIFSRVC